MQQLLLVSIIIVPFLIAAACARDPHPVRGLRRLLVLALLCHATYLFAVLIVYPRL